MSSSEFRRPSFQRMPSASEFTGGFDPHPEDRLHTIPRAAGANLQGMTADGRTVLPHPDSSASSSSSSSTLLTSIISSSPSSPSSLLRQRSRSRSTSPRASLHTITPESIQHGVTPDGVNVEGMTADGRSVAPDVLVKAHRLGDHGHGDEIVARATSCSPRSRSRGIDPEPVPRTHSRSPSLSSASSSRVLSNDEALVKHIAASAGLPHSLAKELAKEEADKK